MLRAIVDQKRVAEIQKSFEKAMLRHLRKDCLLNFGHQGGNTTLKVYHDDDLWFATDRHLLPNRYWNVYGLNPNSSKQNINTVQINVPVKGINRLIGGLFAEEICTKKIYLLHRGKVGGGRKRIGKLAFISWYKGKIVTVDELDGRHSKLLMVTSIRDPHINQKIAQFVMKVDQFKSGVTKKHIK
jgi:5-methylcytosine-specific restriction enzyme A